jgi:exodeoxyribonuclease-3
MGGRMTNASQLYSGPMKIITWNVNGIRARQAQVTELIAQEQPEILCLQELKAKPEQVPEALRERDDYWCYWHGAAAYSGVSLHLRKDRFPRPPKFMHPPFDHEARIVEARLSAAGLGELVVASVYVPNGGKDYAAKLVFLKAMAAYAQTTHDAGRALIMCGDINVTRTDRDVHPKERKPNAIGQRPDERALLERLLGCGLIDVGRTLDPDNDNLFTWWAPWRNLRQRNIGWRLDYVLASEAWARRATSCPVLRAFGTSDHGPVVATFAAS